MTTYKIYRHPSEGLAEIKCGVSWPALFFGFVWIGAHRFWGRAGFWFAASMLVLHAFYRGGLSQIAAHETAGHWLLAACWLGLNSICFIQANRWREEHLKARGYKFLEAVYAESPSEALSRMRAKIALLAERDRLAAQDSGHVPGSLDMSQWANFTTPQVSYRETRRGRENDLRWHWNSPY